MTINDAPARATEVPARARAYRWVPIVATVAADFVVVASVVSLASLLRMRLPYFVEARDIDNVLGVYGGPLVALWLVILALSSAYDPRTMTAGSTEYKNVIRGTLYTAAAVGISSFLLQIPLSRGFFFIAFSIGIPALLIERLLLRQVLHRLHRANHLTERVLIAGSLAQVDEVAKVLDREQWLGYRVVGALVPAYEAAPVTTMGIEVLGTTARTGAVVKHSRADIILFAGGAVESAAEMRQAAWDLESSDVRVMIVPSLTDVASDRVRVRPAAGLQMMEIEGPRAHAATRLSKRAFDAAGSLGLIVLFSPVFLVTAFAVRRNDGGPILFRQRRVGRGGETFECLKFRSMIVDADQLVSTIEAENKHGDDHVLFKVKNDPRITKPGRTIRRYSIDELPQLFNVLRGEMSLVGPRPPLPEEVERYTSDVRRRLAVRPGMTGLWQVSGRSDLSWEDSVRLDLYYVDNWSMTRDLLILLRTLHAVVSSRGAY